MMFFQEDNRKVGFYLRTYILYLTAEQKFEIVILKYKF